MASTHTWKELVAEALRELGGEASLRDITKKLERHPNRPQTPTWNATIRRVVRQYRIFEPVKTTAGLAGYRLVELAPAELPALGKIDDPHGEQQGMLLKLGAICSYETFTNLTDRTIRTFQGQSISDFATVRNDAQSLATLPLDKVRTTDVMWMTDDSEGLYPRYAFEVEESTKVRSGLIRLLRIPERFQTQLFIIGPSEKEAELFERHVRDAPFRQHAHRFRFVRYTEVSDFYKCGVDFGQHRKNWGIELKGKR